MSRNFELLRQAERDHELIADRHSSAVPTDGRKARLDLEALTREEAAKLVQRVFLMPGTDAPRALVFSGVEAGDGSSWICARAGETLASQTAGNVCVVDANLRTPSLHRYFRAENLSGLTDAVLQPGPVRSFAQRLRGGNLSLITCGSHTADPQALLTSDGLQSRIKDLRSEFDYVLIDAPPVSLYTDAVLLGKLADGVILVVQANSTRRETARKAKASLESAKVRLLGAVLNKRTFPIPETLYRMV